MTTHVTEIAPATLLTWMQDGNVTVVDVRSSAEFESLHIRGSYNVPLHLLSEHAEDIADRLDQRVVLVCHSGVRAAQARQRLSAAGLQDAHVLDGGAAAYAAAGGAVVEGKQAWAMERQVRMAAGSLVLAGVLGGQLLSPKLRLLSGGVGAGLAYSAATNTCAMGSVLAKMPWNRDTREVTPQDVLDQLPSGR
ncbi:MULTISPECIES: rhodanese-like domain-containing protein [Kocuria]|uniref:Rhodanese-like domain-containing protein n=1 Tax=Kocuria subflava TaxID=1736139 RepID=A0A846TMD6_9MICC|nr:MULTISPECIES: rhodanese-like domain-containing protein [Kocuria]NKE09613.1 rhodanese-like domain-containing protein [Kocuria subflava]